MVDPHFHPPSYAASVAKNGSSTLAAIVRPIYTLSFGWSILKTVQCTIQGTIIILSHVCCNYAITESGGKVSISLQHIRKITPITALCSSI